MLCALSMVSGDRELKLLADVEHACQRVAMSRDKGIGLKPIAIMRPDELLECGLAVPDHHRKEEDDVSPSSFPDADTPVNARPRSWLATPPTSRRRFRCGMRWRGICQSRWRGSSTGHGKTCSSTEVDLHCGVEE